MTFEFPAGSTELEVKTPDQHLESAKEWTKLAAGSFLTLTLELGADAKIAALEALTDLESKLAGVRRDLTEGIALEAVPPTETKP